jgi:hypothetical protein
MSFFPELHRRSVVRVGIACTVTAWLAAGRRVMENIIAPARHGAHHSARRCRGVPRHPNTDDVSTRRRLAGHSRWL